MKTIKASPYFAALVALGLIGLPAPWSMRPADARPAPSALEVFESLSLKDQNGQAFSLAQLKDQTVVLNFMFTGCTASCPLQTRQLVQVYKAIPAESMAHIRFVSVSVDPKRDTPQRLKSYAKAIGADQPRWSFLSGSPAAIARLTSQLRIYDPSKPKPGPGDHSTAIRLFDRQGQLMQRYTGAPLDVARLAREIPELDRLRAGTVAPPAGPQATAAADPLGH